MKVDFDSAELAPVLWHKLYKTWSLFKLYIDQTFKDYGLTSEQYGVLVSIAYLGEPARVTDIARYVERSPNSVSMIVDRMVKAGLVRRARDRADRRVVYVSKTSKAEATLKPAGWAGLESVQKILSPMSYEERLVLLDLLARLRYEILRHLNPEADITKLKREELGQLKNTKKWLKEYGIPSTT
jgi:DNA-binding MarR family transcriptional regulator